MSTIRNQLTQFSLGKDIFYHGDIISCRDAGKSKNLWVHILVQGLLKEQVLLLCLAKSLG